MLLGTFPGRPCLSGVPVYAIAVLVMMGTVNTALAQTPPPFLFVATGGFSVSEPLSSGGALLRSHTYTSPLCASSFVFDVDNFSIQMTSTPRSTSAVFRAHGPGRILNSTHSSPIQVYTLGVSGTVRVTSTYQWAVAASLPANVSANATAWAASAIVRVGNFSEQPVQVQDSGSVTQTLEGTTREDRVITCFGREYFLVTEHGVVLGVDVAAPATGDAMVQLDIEAIRLGDDPDPPDDRPDLEVTEVVPVQVVPGVRLGTDQRIDLVALKPTVVRTTLAVHNALALDPGDPITTRVYVDGVSVAEDQRPFSTLSSQGYRIEFDIGFIANTAQNIRVVVNPDRTIAENDFGNNDQAVSVRVRDTRGLHVAYLRVDCMGPLAHYASTVQQAAQFVAAQYPVAPGKLKTERFDESIPCTGAWAQEAYLLLLAGRDLTNGAADRVVGIVDDSWIASRNPVQYPINGLTECDTFSAFVLDGRWDSVSHELGHTFGLSHQAGAADPCRHPGGPEVSVEGYWVEQGKPVQNLTSMMHDVGPPVLDFPKPNSWITVHDYTALFEEFVQGSMDPEVLIIGGTIQTDGSIWLGPLRRLPAGIIDKSRPGDWAVRVYDSNQQLLVEHRFDVRFAAALTSVPFGFSIPYPAGAHTFTIERSGDVLLQQPIGGRLLKDAVTAIPDHGFGPGANGQRRALLAQADAFEQATNGRQTFAAVAILRAMQANLKRWLVDGYELHNPIQLTKARILALTDSLLLRLDTAIP